MLELSLAIAFALVVLTTSLQLIQESTDRINKGMEFKEFQELAFRTLVRINKVANWDWHTSIDALSVINSSLTNNSSLTKTSYNFTNNQWISSNNSNDAQKIVISNPKFTKNLSVYFTNYRSKEKLIDVYLQ